ncbi:thiosulfate/3-mercaptopyruvate sulfurtransferase [Paenibacillus sp. SORGH_AS306]|uniref:sulfurtransferase n=1 Tax=unclassified Paenibacillus TaxID=185978 RepID=UPI002787402A|nr:MULTISPECIES: sulfurtransferase [unclassified Paenibacillus]MDQ1235133.1 thiosulfate/3-mercaptopyruvate sulfurtransferase [Paenibacillus sp. SORGH_AS_0306]MDR6112180.1 thiosulfate/3-mercaptopyruvate sulfurtransferase [Paenibacillus sp. SORGH_AS_0338]
MQNIVSMKWLLARLYEPDMVIVDCRFWLNDKPAGAIAYQAEHIPGAVYLDLETDLSAPVTAHGGRHPLPDVDQLALTLGKAGIHSNSRVVVYDDNKGLNAARLWWMLHYVGHEQVYVLNEGFTTWKNANFPVTSDQPVVIPTTFVPNVQPELLADVEEVRQVSQAYAQTQDNASLPVLIDSREHKRYLGLEEPIDPKAGHIPGAVNYFWLDTRHGEEDRYDDVEQLEKHFAELDKEQPIIVYCGSGVSACPNVLALNEAGYKNVKLYSGSWSDWISYEENQIAIGKE